MRRRVSPRQRANTFTPGGLSPSALSRTLRTPQRANTFTPGGLSPSALSRTLRTPKPDMAQAASRGRAQHSAWAQGRRQGPQRMQSSSGFDFETAFRRGSAAPAQYRAPPSQYRAPPSQYRAPPSQYRAPPSRAPVMRGGGLAPRYKHGSISRRGGYARHYVSNQVLPGFRGIDLLDKKTIALLGVAAIGLYFVFTPG